MLKFSDGVSVDTSGPLRPKHLHDGWYVVGEGMMLPVNDLQEAIDVIREETERKKQYESTNK